MTESSSSEIDNYCETKREKKGVRNTECYKHEVIKKAKVKGLLHENYAGKIIAPRGKLETTASGFLI